jgi:hypothetical protein
MEHRRQILDGIIAQFVGRARILHKERRIADFMRQIKQLLGRKP